MKNAARNLICAFLDAKFYLFELYQGIKSEKLHPSHQSNILKPDHDIPLVSDSETIAFQWLRQNLVSFPYWINGHINLARLALKIRETEFAYSSAQAAFNLSTTPKTQDDAQLIIAEAHTKAASFEQAKNIYEKLGAGNLDNNSKENLAACYVALEKPHLAREVLQMIKSEELSQSAAVMLQHLR